MEKAGWILVVSLALQLLTASSEDLTGWLSIDCGSNDWRLGDNLIAWDVDAAYTQTGTNSRVQQTQTTNLEEMNSLRFFPNKTQENCYIVPAELQTMRYIVRAGFYYGNYDELSSPPTFDLYIDDGKWATIDTSRNNGKPYYQEAIYQTHGSGYFKICLVQTKDGDVPFINLIEVVPLWVNLYPKMESNDTFNLVTRTNLGGDEIRFTGVASDEQYNRIWTKGITPSNCTRVDVITDFTSTYENDPPYLALFDSVQSNGSDPVTLTVDLPQVAPQSAYFVFYITETFPKNSNQTRAVTIQINGQDEGTVETPDVGKSMVVTKYPVIIAGPTVNITLTRGNGSSLPPSIAAMEVFTKSDINHTTTGHKPKSSAATPKYFSFAYLLTFCLALLLVP